MCQDQAAPNSPELSLLKLLPLTYHHTHFLAATLDSTSFFTIAFLRATLFFLQLGCFGLYFTLLYLYTPKPAIGLTYFFYHRKKKKMKQILNTLINSDFISKCTNYISRHMIHAAQEVGAPHRGYIDRKKENVIFTLFYPRSLIRLEPNLLQSCPPAKGVYTPNLKEIVPAISEIRAAKISIFLLRFCSFFFVVSHTCKNCYKTQTRTPVALKFGTQKGSPKANSSITFGANPMNGSRVITDYARKTRSICCHAYRVNRFME